MKKFAKILAVLFSLAVVLAVGVIAISATDEEYTVTWKFGSAEPVETPVDALPEYSQGDYAVYNVNGWRASYKVTAVSTSGNNRTITLDPTDVRYYSITIGESTTYVTNTTLSEVSLTLSEKLHSDVTNLVTESTVTLMSDVSVNKAISIASKTVYIDLNGFRWFQTSETADGVGTAISTSGTAKLYIYSSRPDGKLFSTGPYASVDTEGIITEKSPRAFVCFGVKDTSQLFLGAYDVADGSNLSIYTHMLANITGSYAEGVNAVTINGGSYYKEDSNMRSMFYLRDNTKASDSGYINISIKDAILNSKDSIFYCYGNTFDTSTKQHNIVVENSVLCSGESAGYSIVRVEPAYEARMNVEFSDSYLLSSPGQFNFITFDSGCRFASPVNIDSSDVFYVRNLEKKSFGLKSNSFKYDYSYDTSAGLTAAIDVSSFVEAVDNTEYLFSLVTATEETSSEITWIDAGGTSVTELWYNGSLPRPSTPLPEGNDIYYYTYGNITAVTEDKTYEAKPVAKFGIKTNLTLESDFLYNVYIPVEADVYIKEVKVWNSAGVSVTLTNNKELITIDGVSYYRYYFNIPAAKSADAYSFDMDIYSDKEAGEYFTQKCPMSIPAYSVQILNNSKYSEKTHNLMNKTLAYVKAVCDYFGTASQNAHYSVINNIETVKDPTYRAGEAKAALDATSTVYDVLDGVRVVFSSQLKYRYYFKTGVDFSATSVTISYPISGETVEATINNSNVVVDGEERYYEVTLPASDMRGDMVITVPNTANAEGITSTSYTYNLSNYIYSVNNEIEYESETDKTKAQNLVFSLWEYSEAASQYVNDAPSIDIKIAGTALESYKIVANSEEELAAARIFAETIEKEHDITLEILSSYDGNTIEFKTAAPDSVFDYKASVADGKLVIECAYRSFYETATTAFVNDNFCNLNNDLNLDEAFTKEYFYGKILYSDFDVPTYSGTAEDFSGKSASEIDAYENINAYFAIKKAHDIANSKGYSVYADKDATYFLGTSKNALGVIETITIKTNTYWNGADFIINDSSLSVLSGSNKDVAKSVVFSVENDYNAVSISPSSIIGEENGKIPLYKTDTKLDSGLGYPAMLYVTNGEHTQYIRYGYDGSGTGQQELILVDAEGNIDPSTPLLFDFSNVTTVTAYRADTKPIVIDGGEGCVITTLSSQVICRTSAYISRALDIQRPNTTITNIEHSILNEPARYLSSDPNTGGHSYNGFFSVTRTTNVTLENCIGQGRKRCKEGTYDINVTGANNVLFRNFDQSNFFEETSVYQNMPNTNDYWWIMGSNFCKNITYDSCKLTRFDAHKGVYNATIKNSEISSIRLTGGGTFTLENTTIYAKSTMDKGFIELREDYGSTWDGTIVIKDCTYDIAGSASIYSDSMYCVNLEWEYHDFGYQTTVPDVVVDNLKVSDRVAEKLENIYIYHFTNSADKSYTYTVTEDGIEKTYTYTFTDPAAILAETDLTKTVFETTVTKTVTDANGEILENVNLTEIENINPYVMPETVLIENKNAAYNYRLVNSGFEAMFASTTVSVGRPFDSNPDSPFVDLLG